ncbi:chondroitin proteoglycan 2 [Aplysia californica]|uniref:Chondroitin proteoglycan 2 n=1 Tax=Aplysia californica TaxID=6500 RepID=A0ABM0JWI6_APLCA|nr:chondroitin proteoglycan 2 [Aplysia californica]
MIAKILLVCVSLFALGSCSSAGVLNLCKQYGWPAGRYPHPTNCRQFIECSNGVTMELDCPVTTVYNPVTKLCDSTANVPICNYGPSVATIVVSNICRQFSWANGNYYQPYDCTQYVECSNGATTVMGCQNGLFYNPALKTCSTTNTCLQYIFQPPTLPIAYPSNFDNYCSVNNLANGIHPDPYSCVSYVECTFGRTNHMPCPTGLSFDRNLLVCDDKQNINCAVVPVGKK